MSVFSFDSENKPKLDANNLKVLQDQLDYEATMNRKANQYSEFCNDQELKNLCKTLSQQHRQNYTDLLNYLNSHQ